MANNDDVIEGLVRRIERPDDESGKPGAGPSAPAAHPDDKVPSSLRRPMIIGLVVLLIGLGGFLTWASIAPLDQGIPATGVVVVESKRKTVQHLSGGIIREIRVREGDAVKQGQVLLVLDPATARAAREFADAQYLLSRAGEARLLAEQRGQSRIDFPPDLMARASEPTVRLLIETQRQLFTSRRQSQASEQASFRDGIAGLESQIKGVEQVERERDEQIRSFAKEIAALAPLVEEGLYARNRYQDLQRQYSMALGARADAQATIARVRNQIAETRARGVVREQEYRKEVESQLADASQNARASAEKLIALTQDLERTEIRAPEDGIVLGLQTHTVGGVIGPGAKVMEIVPAGDSFIVEAQVSPLLIKHVHKGLPAQLRFIALDPKLTPVVDGRVVTVSPDLLTDEKGNQFFLARIEVPVKALADLGYTNVQPGMPVEALIITGERSLLQYLFKPLADRFARGMKEH
jgi:protease secretion system membrane fusion protein